MTMGRRFHGTIAAVSFFLCAFAALFGAAPLSLAANPTVELLFPREGTVVKYVFEAQMLPVRVVPKNPNKPPGCYNAVLKFRTPPEAGVI